jgi:lipoate-protein ligase A
MQAWRLLDFEYADAAANLAFEEALTRQVGAGESPPTFRLWRNRKAAVIGENQSASVELHLDACERMNVQVVRRFSGGGAVYHDAGNLNYTICTPKPSASSLEQQRAVFRRGVECAVTLLRKLSLAPVVVPVNAVTVGGRKISGGAAAVRWGATLYHASVMVSTDLEAVWKILRNELQPPASDARFVQSTRLPVTSLTRELGREVLVDDVKHHLAEVFAGVFDAQLVPASASDHELEIASTLVDDKYGCDARNLKK